MLNPVFSPKHMRDLAPIFYPIAHQLCDILQQKVEETDDEDLDDDDVLGDDDIGEEENDRNGSTDEEEEWGGISENTAIAGQESIAAESSAEAPSGKYSLVRIWLGTESAS